MAAEHLEALKRIYAGWERGDFTVGVAEFEHNAILVIDPEIPEAGVYVGLEGIRSYTSGFLHAWEHIKIVAESFEEVGDSVLVKVKQTGTGRDSGAVVTMDYFHLWTFRGGKVIRLDSILREAQAREAVGPAG